MAVNTLKAIANHFHFDYKKFAEFALANPEEYGIDESGKEFTTNNMDKLVRSFTGLKQNINETVNMEDGIKIKMEAIKPFHQVALAAKNAGLIQDLMDSPITHPQGYDGDVYFTMMLNDDKYDMVQYEDASHTIVLYQDIEGSVGGGQDDDDISIDGFKKYIAQQPKNKVEMEPNQINESVKTMVLMLQKMTGKKVMAEVIERVPMEENVPLEEDATTMEQPLSKRRQGAQQATITKGQDVWTMEQYAFVYFLVKYGKSSMPEPYRNLPFDKIAEEMGVKVSTIAKNAENVKFILKGESSLMSSSPKSEEFVEKFQSMPKEAVWNLVIKALDTGYQKRDIAKKVPAGFKSANSLSPDQLKTINDKRAAKGLPPYDPAARN